MIKRDELVKIGKFNKPHGIKGEISFSFTNDSFDESECPFLICELDGIFVPFKLEEYRFTSDAAALVKLKNITTEEKVKVLANKEVYFSKKYLKEETDDHFTWDYFIGFTLIDERTGEIGLISDVDVSTLNTLFIIEKEDDEIFIPAADEMITHIDEAQKRIYMELPEGILDD
ncbi:MAG: ribosome maturation factor RimM [Candidatus Symbiothrix sp.]|jgi:16S rRNA processing protein RimM|nr:ribosome maturation factor RimM [Candidatus Symbiothrix sp.]